MKFSILIATALIVLYSLFLHFGPQPKNIRIQSQWQENRYVLEKYFRLSSLEVTQRPRIVIAGSSLSERLDFSEFKGCVYNISLSGESMMTGVAAVLNSGQRPTQIFIEINIATRPVNTNLIKNADRFLPRIAYIFRTENMPINKAFSFMASGTKGPKASSVNTVVFENALQSKKDAYQKQLPAELLESNLKELASLAESLKEQRTEIIFFEMPINPQVENLPQVIQIRTAFEKKFANYRLVGYRELVAENPIHTVDGIHLDPNEAARASEKLATRFHSDCSSLVGK